MSRIEIDGVAHSFALAWQELLFYHECHNKNGEFLTEDFNGLGFDELSLKRCRLWFCSTSVRNIS